MPESCAVISVSGFIEREKEAEISEMRDGAGRVSHRKVDRETGFIFTFDFSV